jgi:hypothetical protein
MMITKGQERSNEMEAGYMTKEQEKKLLLAIALPAKWDAWLNKMADVYSPSLYDPDSVYTCLFCAAFDGNCNLCQDPGGLTNGSCFRRCWSIPREEIVDRAIWRLNELGLWKEEESV